MLRILTGLALTAALLAAAPAFAQSAHHAAVKPVAKRTAAPATRPAPPKEAAAGTYQLLRLTNKRTVSITTDALTEIERRRHETDEVRWVVSPYAVVRILPRRVISAPDFVPVEPVANAY